MKNKTLLALAISVGLISGCSSVPYSKNHEMFSDMTKTEHDSVRRWQKDQFGARYLNTSRVMEANAKKFGPSNCYRIQTEVSQWGLLQPETIFTGEGAFSPHDHVMIYVAPLLENGADLPALADEPNTKVYRVDTDAPMAREMTELLRRASGQNEVCVHLERLPDNYDSNRTRALVAIELVEASKASAPVLISPTSSDNKEAPKAEIIPEMEKHPKLKGGEKEKSDSTGVKTMDIPQ